jgi:hypothetical protein
MEEESNREGEMESDSEMEEEGRRERGLKRM